MPKMGGRELCWRCVSDPNVKVIVMSGYPLDVEVEDILVGEHIAWLPKPLRLGDLAARVRAMLDRNGSGALPSAQDTPDDAQSLHKAPGA